jgi:signal transduction histidine kinase
MSVSTHKIKAKSHILSLLGDELIGSDSLAIFELVKNSYDADAENVTITFNNLNTPEQNIIIEDDGHGMSPKTIQDVWLTIGTDFKRGVNRKVSKKYKRVSLGNKGVGRLAVHKLAKKITLETQTQGEMFSNRLTIDWEQLIKSKEFIQDLEVDIDLVGEQLFAKGCGTRIILNGLTTKNWTKVALRDLVRKIENIKNPFVKFPDFEVQIDCNDFHKQWIEDIHSSIKILNESLYQFDFTISKREDRQQTGVFKPDGFAEFKWNYTFNPPNQTQINKNNSYQSIIHQEDSFELKNVFLIGDLFKELGQTDYNKYLRNKDLDNIGTIRGKFFVFNQNSVLLNMNFGTQITAIKKYIAENCGVKIFRDDIRVYNYGEPFDDWLGLDLMKIQRAGDHFGKKVTIGIIELKLGDSINGLIEKTNREGFLDNYTYSKFQSISNSVFKQFERVASIDKDKIELFLESTLPIKKIGLGETIRELEQKLNEKNLQLELSPLIKRVDKEYTDMRDIMVNSGMTGLNLGVAFHEVEREMKFINIELNSKEVDVENIKSRVNILLKILENLSPILKQSKKITTSAFDLVDRAKQINVNRFNFHNVVFSSPLLSKENQNFAVKGPGNLLVSAVSNLIDNGIFWTTAKRDLTGNNFKPAIFIGSDVSSFDGNAIIIADNGDGFTLEPEYLTQPFKTTREGGMGLGLYFADLVMSMLGGKLLFPDNADLDIPKVYSGACIVLVFPKN